MKKIFSLIVLLAGVIQFTSCGEDDATYTSTPKLDISQANVLFEAEGGTGSITINTASSVTATTESSWLTVSASGNKVTATASPNASLNGRSALIFIKEGNLQATVTATQKGSVFGIAGGFEYELADTQGSSVSIPVVHTSDVSVQSLADWLTASFNSATDEIEIVAASNDAETPREGLVAFATGTVKDTLVITQSAILFNLEKDAIEIPNTGDIQYIGVEHSRPVTVEADVDWISCELNEKGDSIVVAVGEGTDEDRQGTITVKSLDFTRSISVIQKGAEENPVEENPLFGTYTFFWAGTNTYNLGDIVIEEYTGEDAEEGDIVIRNFYIPGSVLYGFYQDDKLYLFPYQPIGILNDPDEGDYGNLLMSASSQDYIVFDITPEGIVSTDLCVMATDPGYAQGWWWEIPAGGTTVFIKDTAEARAFHRAAIKGGIKKTKSHKNLPKKFKLFHK